MAVKSAPFSIRLSKRFATLVDKEVARTGRSRGAIVEELAEEGLRMRLFPGIAFKGADAERRAWVIGTALDVWQIVDAHRDIGSVQIMAEGGSVNERQIELALAYHEMFPEEIDTAIRENRRTIEELQKEFPFIAVSFVED